MYRVHFNSQPHEEADADLLAGTISTNISTHSLTKRLTTIFLLFRLCSMYFNSQPHEEADGSTTDEKRFLRIISTHSLTKRLTIPSLGILLPGYYFNSQPHEEADTVQRRSYAYIRISTHSLTKRLTVVSFAFRMSNVFQLTASRRG